jgi:membrane fusion protein, multidrug efflux system
MLENRNTVVSPQQVDQARSELQSADAAHTVYLTRLRKTRIVAPFSGTLGIRRFSPGDYVQPGQDLVNLEDVRTINVDCKVPEAFLSRVAVGQTVQVMTDAYPGEVFTGEIAALDPRIDAVNRAVRVPARVPNAQGKLGPGLFATVRLILGIAGDQKKLGFTIHALLREDRYTLTVTRNRKSVRPSRGIHDICV